MMWGGRAFTGDCDHLLCAGCVQNDRGITPLGVAVGFNRKEAVAWLLEHGADVAQRDSKGNSVLHYAAGYGRQEVADMLLAAGAQLDASNDAKQKPVDVARLNGEVRTAVCVVMFFQECIALGRQTMLVVYVTVCHLIGCQYHHQQQAAIGYDAADILTYYLQEMLMYCFVAVA